MNRRTAIKTAASAAFLPLIKAQSTPPGSGATNARDYGAIGDGVADDTAALQAALQAAKVSAQRYLYIPSGTYKVSCTAGDMLPLDVPSLTIVGDGIGRTILQDAESITLTNHLHRIAIRAANCTVRDLSIYGSPTMSGTFDTTGVSAYHGALSFNIARVEVVGIYGYGSAGGSGFDCYQDPAIGNGWQWGVMEDCTARDMPLCTGFGTASNGNHFLRCRALRCGNSTTRHAFYAQGGNNHFEQCYAESAGGFSFHAHKQSQALDASGDIYDGCTSINPGLKHMIVDSYTPPGGQPLTRYVTIRNCLFKGAAEGLDTRVPALIEGCVFEDVRKQGQRSIIVNVGAQGSVVKGNYLKNSYGIVTSAAATIADNSIESTYGGTGISLAAPGSVARGNRVTIAGIPSVLSATGIGIEASGVIAEDNYLSVTAPGACISFNAGVSGQRLDRNELKPLGGAWVYSVPGGNFLGPMGTDVIR